MAGAVYLPGPDAGSVRCPRGTVLRPPADWELLPPGDPGLTRRVKAAGDHWLVEEKVGRKRFSRGVWAPRVTIARIRGELAAERATDAYARRREADVRRREVKQVEYVDDFEAAVVAFLLVAWLSLEGMFPGGAAGSGGRFGAIASGGWIPLLNVLVALKVTLGSWAMVQLLVRYRGLF